jgi:hypothetical protein
VNLLLDQIISGEKHLIRRKKQSQKTFMMMNSTVEQQQRRLQVLQKHLIINDSSPLQLNQTSTPLNPSTELTTTIPQTGSLNELRAFHSSQQSLASKLLREKEKKFFDKNAVVCIMQSIVVYSLILTTMCHNVENA